MKETKTNIFRDPKNVIITVLLLGVLVFAAIVFYGGDSAYKKRVKELQAENKVLQAQRDSIDSVITGLENDYQDLLLKEAALLADIAQRDAGIQKAKDDANRSKVELDRIKKDLEKTRAEIKKHETNPANRTGDDLLNSLKFKTQ
jgi:septal ring factor EnvC (AmiA/AmiB activator)